MAGSLKQRLSAGDQLLGSWVSIGHPAVAEIAAGSSVEFVTVDTEHAPLSVGDVENMLRAVDAADGSTDAVVRVAWNDPVRIKRLLDVGADGIMVPMVETAEEAEAAVDAVRYPPDGNRGIAAARASDYGRSFEKYVATANDELAVIVQIESEQGLENAAEIAAVDGVDALFVGPADLSAAVGALGEWEAPAVTDAVDRVLSAGEDANVPVGTLAITEADIDRWMASGFDFLVAGVDATHIVEGHRRMQDAYSRALADNSSGPVRED